MKKNHVIFCLFGILLINFSCKSKEEVLKPLPQKNNSLALDTLWTSYIGGYSINPILNSNRDILMSKTFNNSNGEIFKMFDGVTGKLKWEWQDYYKFEEGFYDNGHILLNDILVLSAAKNTYALNTITGKTVWRNQMTTLVGENSIFKDNDGYVYQGYNDLVNNFTSHVYRTKYNEGKWEQVCTFIDSTKSYDIIYSTPMAFSKNDKGEKMMIYTMYLASNTNNSKYSAKVCGYNMVTKKYDWIKDYTNKYAEFMGSNIKSTDSKVFINAAYAGDTYLVAINANDGSIAWDKLMPDLGVGIFLYNDKLISLSNGSNSVYCFDQNTGNIIWQQDFTPEMLANMNFTFGDSKVFKNYLLSTQCDYLLVLNLDNGSIVYFKNIALPNGCLQFGLEINEEKRCFYVQDRISVVCYKLPDEVKY
jgi:outer membrane protein assembly factor BamB